MNRFPGRPADERRILCEQASALHGLEATSIEKDFWVCWTLRALFCLTSFGEHLTFKGGTSLSKGWNLIERFSEDIDVVVSREYLGFGGDQAPERAASKKEGVRRLDRLRTAASDFVTGELRITLTAICRAHLPPDTWELSLAEGDVDDQTLLLRYPTAFPPAGGYVQRLVRIELGARSDTEPLRTPTITPYAAEVLPGEFKDSQFTLRTVAPERTFWEKAMLLHEETYGVTAGTPKARLSRHYYDLWCLIRAGVGDLAIAAEGLFEHVADHRRLYFKRRADAQRTLKRGCLHLTPVLDQVGHWRRDYDAMREAMFFGEPPTFDEILRVVGEFQDRFNQR